MRWRWLDPDDRVEERWREALRGTGDEVFEIRAALAVVLGGSRRLLGRARAAGWGARGQG
jgi:hypothetical protein